MIKNKNTNRLWSLLICTSFFLFCSATSEEVPLYKYLSKGRNNRMFESHEQHSSNYLVLFDDSTFFYEVHVDINFRFVCGEYSLENNQLIFRENLNKSREYIRRNPYYKKHKYVAGSHDISKGHFSYDSLSSESSSIVLKIGNKKKIFRPSKQMD